MNPAIEELSDGTWVIRNDSHVSKWVREWGTLACDPALFSDMRKWLDKPEINTIWDVGAFIGDHTFFYLSLGKTVVAVEPNPVAFECLSHNCPDAILLNLAASWKPGTLRFSPNDNAGASRITTDGPAEVRSAPLDNLNLPTPDFVKIDAEGWEYDVLQGMGDTLQCRRPLLFIEIDAGALAENGRDHTDITNLLRSFGYTRFQIHPPDAKWGDPQYDILVIR